MQIISTQFCQFVINMKNTIWQIRSDQLLLLNKYDKYDKCDKHDKCNLNNWVRASVTIAGWWTMTPLSSYFQKSGCNLGLGHKKTFWLILRFWKNAIQSVCNNDEDGLADFSRPSNACCQVENKCSTIFSLHHLGISAWLLHLYFQTFIFTDKYLCLVFIFSHLDNEIFFYIFITF